MMKKLTIFDILEYFMNNVSATTSIDKNISIFIVFIVGICGWQLTALVVIASKQFQSDTVLCFSV